MEAKWILFVKKPFEKSEKNGHENKKNTLWNARKINYNDLLIKLTLMKQEKSMEENEMENEKT